MSAEWTPGPWVARQNPMRTDGWFVWQAERRDSGAVVLTANGTEPYMVSKPIINCQIGSQADATLIAAAPDLYEALKPFAALGETSGSADRDEKTIRVKTGDLRRASAALKKARGA